MTYTEYIDGIPVHPHASKYPMMSGDDLQALADDIKANGQREPIVLAHVDGIQSEQMVVIDGRNRHAACQLAGVEPEYRTNFLVSGDEIPALIDSLNLHRRHLTPEQKREHIKDALAKNPELPDYQIAKRTNTSPHTVKKVRQENPELHSANERVNARGQKRPATYDSRPPSTIDRDLERRARAMSSAPDSGAYIAGETEAGNNARRLDALRLSRRMVKDARELVVALSLVGGVKGVEEQLGEVTELIAQAVETGRAVSYIDAELERLLDN